MILAKRYEGEEQAILSQDETCQKTEAGKDDKQEAVQFIESISS